MGKLAYVFAGRNGLDPFVVRANVLRIPEVSLRVRQAQEILDGLEISPIDLHSSISAADEFFRRNIRLKGLAAAVVQVGLFDRLAKQSKRRPDILAGPVDGDSALATVLGRQTFEEMIHRSPALETLKPLERLTLVVGAEPAPLLAGMSLGEFEAVARASTGFMTVQAGLRDATKLLGALIEENGVRTFVNIGPAGLAARDALGITDIAPDIAPEIAPDIEVLDSIDLDPMLGWFWSSLRPGAKAIAN